MPRKTKCSICGTPIVGMLVDVSPAADTVCLECSGATPEDFMDSELTEDDYVEDQAETMRTFHGKSQYD